MSAQGVRLGMLGCGNLGSALLSGWREHAKIPDGRIVVCDSTPEKVSSLVPGFTGKVTQDAAAVVSECDVLVVAVKPKEMSALSASIRSALDARSSAALIVSVASGIRVDDLEWALGKNAIVVRAMPNLASRIGLGVTALYGKRDEDVRRAEELFSSIGIALRVATEAELDTVTALGASAPAFVFQIIEAFADGGVKMGLARDAAMAISAQMTLGAAAMVTQTGIHPAKLKDQVASPGGTTIAGLHVLEKAGVRGALMSAVEAATLRAREASAAGKGNKEREK